MGNLKAFQIKAGSKVFDYRLGKQLNLKDIRSLFKKSYKVRKLWPGGRHILGILEKNNKKLFLKLSTTEGISKLTKNEYQWNKQFNKLVPRKFSNYWVPKNIDSGIYQGKFFYLITDYFDGQLLAERPSQSKVSSLFLKNITYLIEFSELIQGLNLASLSIEENSDFRKTFFNKIKSWYKAVPENIIDVYKINYLIEIVEDNIGILQSKPQHGDFSPWHLIKLASGQLGLIDGEHAKKNGVEYYDIGYFIQRVFSELKNHNLAEKILSMLVKKNYQMRKLKIILAARGIGGFLDESLKPSPNYTFSNNFKNWVISLT